MTAHPNQPRPIPREVLEREIEADRTQEEIAENLDVPRSRVRRYLKKYDLLEPRRLADALAQMDVDEFDRLTGSDGARA